MSGPRRTEPTRSLLKGGAYTPADKTNLRERFARIRAEQEAKGENVAPLRRTANERGSK